LFIQAAEQTGIPGNADFNGADQEGVGYFQLNINRRGKRCSSASAFLKPAAKRPNLRVVTAATAHRLEITDKRVSGVVYELDGQMLTAHCNAEVLLSAGALGSPQLLMLSGIGDQQALAQHDIPIHQHLAGVGENLQDHLQVRSIYRVNQAMTLNDELRNPLRKISMALEYALFGTGPLTMAASQVAIFTRSNKAVERPDIQFHLQPMSADNPADGTHNFSAFTASVCQLRPGSRGRLKLRSNNAHQHIAIHPNYLSTAEDQQTVIDGVRLTRRLVAAPALRSLIAEEHEPGEDCQSDDELLDFARRRATTIYHPVGPCKMGPATDTSSVVDARLRVHGLNGLRVVDCSIMPQIVSGNTNAAAIMIAEKAADMIQQDAQVTETSIR